MAGRREILICVTGGISAYKACELVTILRKNDYPVTVLMSKEAARFVSKLTFKTLSGQEVIDDMFAENYRHDPTHIALAEKADIIAVAPATANIIAKLAVGICDDIISCVIMAAKAKIMICPAMNDNMYNHPALQTNINKLKSFGYKIIPPVEGRLACGKFAIGHLADIQTIFAEIEKLLQ